MDTLVWFFLESTAALGAALFLTLFWLLVYWRRSGHVRPLLIGAGVACALLAVQELVTTRREHVAQVMDAVEQDLVAGRVDALAAALSRDFRAGAMDRSAFVDYVRDRLRDVRIQSVGRTEVAITAGAGERFDAELAYGAQVAARDYAGPVRTRWRVSFVRADGRWRIDCIDPVSLENTPIEDWAAFIRLR